MQVPFHYVLGIEPPYLTFISICSAHALRENSGFIWTLCAAKNIQPSPVSPGRAIAVPWQQEFQYLSKQTCWMPLRKQPRQDGQIILQMYQEHGVWINKTGGRRNYERKFRESQSGQIAWKGQEYLYGSMIPTLGSSVILIFSAWTQQSFFSFQWQ